MTVMKKQATMYGTERTPSFEASCYDLERSPRKHIIGRYNQMKVPAHCSWSYIVRDRYLFFWLALLSLRVRLLETGTVGNVVNTDAVGFFNVIKAKIRKKKLLTISICWRYVKHVTKNCSNIKTSNYYFPNVTTVSWTDQPIVSSWAFVI